MTALLVLIATIAPLSLVTQGTPAMIPELTRVAGANGWLTPRQFAELYAIVQASPGPNATFLTAYGWRAAGLPGALVAQASMIVPTSILVYGVARSWDRFRERRITIALIRGLSPLAVGFVMASGVTIASAVDRTTLALAVTAGALLVAYFTRVHLLAIVAAAALLGLLGIFG
ncbi:MAG: chromate transporter [Chloroflexota bacterium]|nr:chromate transporter [Chloroflexota bacterium]